MPDPETLLWRNISELPYFRGLLRAVEGNFYQPYQLKEPILDLGCGDGHFASVTSDKEIGVGVDPWFTPLQKAHKSGCYKHSICALGDQLPFETAYFNTLISNSVLEHIPDVEAVLIEASRVLKPGGIFFFCVPNDLFTKNLSFARFLDQLHLTFLANGYRRFFNQISRHHHCDDPEVWETRLKKCGFRVKKWWNYFSPRALSVLEWGHLFGLPSLFCHALFGRWILMPTHWNLFITQSIVKQSFYESPAIPSGAYSFFIAIRK
jgi:SAM-dependent methyltransferase